MVILEKYSVDVFKIQFYVLPYKTGNHLSCNFYSILVNFWSKAIMCSGLKYIVVLMQ